MRLMKGVLTAVVTAASLAVAGAQMPSPATVQGNRPPSVKLKSPDRLLLASGCGEDDHPESLCRGQSPKVQLTADASDPDGDRLLYTYLTTGGVLSGDGAKTTLDLTGVHPGYYEVTVEVSDGRGGRASDTTRITVERCNCPPPIPLPPPCPTVTVNCPDTPGPGRQITYTANVSGGDPNVTPTFKWTVPGYAILSGQGTSVITIETLPTGGMMTATVEVGGYDRSCRDTANCTTRVIFDPGPRKVGEYGNIRLNDEKSRLDNFAIELQNDPTAQGYLVCYGGRHGRAGEALRLCGRARDYLIKAHGVDARSLVTIDGGYREGPAVELWVVPSGVVPPQTTPTVDPSEVTPPPTPRGAPRRRGRR